MRQALYDLLDELDRLGPKLRRDLDQRVNSFRYEGGNTVGNREALTQVLADFLNHLVMPQGSLSRSDSRFSGAQAYYLLERSHGRDYVANLDSIVGQSAEGGLRAVLDKVLESFFWDQIDGKAGLVVDKFWQRYEVAEKYRNLDQDTRDYLAKYESLLPPEFVADPQMVSGKFKRVLTKHARLIVQSQIPLR